MFTIAKRSKLTGKVKGTEEGEFKFFKSQGSGTVYIKLHNDVSENLPKALMAELAATFTVSQRGNPETGAGYVLRTVLTEPKKGNNARYLAITITTTSFEEGAFVIEKASKPVAPVVPVNKEQNLVAVR